MTEREAFLRRFHAAAPGITSRAFARGGTYERIAALVPPDARVLDLACGDGALLAALDRRAIGPSAIGPRAIGIDLSRQELALARGNAAATDRVVQGRAQALPFADRAFDVCTCHLAFMLFDEIDRVVAELARVLVPGGSLIALLGGGPTADGDDAFHRFLPILAGHARAPLRFGDPRAKSEHGWRELFATWHDVRFERVEVDLAGSFDEVWAFLGASYEVPVAAADAIRAELDAATESIADENGRIPCRAVTWLARVRR